MWFPTARVSRNGARRLTCHHRVVQLVGEVEHVVTTTAGDAGAVHQDVDATEVGDDRLHQRIDRGGVTQVDDVRRGVRPDLLDLRCHPLGTLRVAVDDDQPRAGAGERDRGGSPDARPAAGHDRDPIGEWSRHVCSSFERRTAEALDGNLHRLVPPAGANDGSKVGPR